MIKTLKILFLFLAVYAHAIAQNKKEIYPVNINNTHYTEKVEILSEEQQKVKPEEDLTYYWYAYNKVMKTEGGYDGKLLHGQYAAFYFNNNLKEKGKFRKGLKDGKWISWYEHGKIMEIVEWSKGKKDGPYRSYDPQGQQVLDANFKNGKLHGKTTSYLDGKILSEKKYRNGEEMIPKEKKSSSKKKDKEKETTDSKPVDDAKESKEGFGNKLMQKIKKIKIFPKKVKEQENTTPAQKTIKEKKKENQIDQKKKEKTINNAKEKKKKT